MTNEVERRLAAYAQQLDAQLASVSIDEVLNHQITTDWVASRSDRRVGPGRPLTFAAAAIALATLGILGAAIRSTSVSDRVASSFSTSAGSTVTTGAPTSSTASDAPPSSPQAHQVPAASTYSTFLADLAASKSIVGSVSIGDPCDAADPTYLTDPSSPQPILVPVALFSPSGECTIQGWAYRVLSPDDIPDSPGTTQAGVPVFDESGAIIRRGTG